jgi:hypothetical protein
LLGSREISNRFLHDFRRTVADLVADEFYQTFSEIAYAAKEFITHPESGGPHSAPIDAVRTMGFNDVPMGEFWVRSNTHRVDDAQRLAVKQSASAAHTFTAGGLWLPKDLPASGHTGRGRRKSARM